MLTRNQRFTLGVLYGFLGAMQRRTWWPSRRRTLNALLCAIEDQFHLTPHPMWGSPPPWRRETGTQGGSALC